MEPVFPDALAAKLRLYSEAWKEEFARTTEALLMLYGEPEEACPPVRCWRPEYEEAE